MPHPPCFGVLQPSIGPVDCYLTLFDHPSLSVGTFICYNVRNTSVLGLYAYDLRFSKRSRETSNPRCPLLDDGFLEHLEADAE